MKIAQNMQHDSSMVIVVSYPFRRPPCCVKRNVRYGSQGTHRDMVSVDIGTPDVYSPREGIHLTMHTS